MRYNLCHTIRYIEVLFKSSIFVKFIVKQPELIFSKTQVGP